MPNGPPVQVCATSVGSELSRQIPVDLEADADLNEGWGCPGHVRAVAQEGYYGAGHDKLHQGFYSQLRRNDGGSCCNLMDCRPTQSRIVGDHYEVKVDGVWTPVPYDKINNVVAPDGGAHVCAPRQVGQNKGVIFCVILPSEG